MGATTDPIKDGRSNKIPYRQAALAAELVENEGLSYRQAAFQTGIDQSTVSRIINKHANWGEITEEPVFKKHRAIQNKLLQAAWRSAAAIGLVEAHKPEKLAKASYYQLMVGSSIATEKANLLAGDPTSIIETQSTAGAATLDDLIGALSEIAQARQAQKAQEIDITPMKTATSDDNVK